MRPEAAWPEKTSLHLRDDGFDGNMLQLADFSGHGGNGLIAAVHGEGDDGHAAIAVGNAQTADNDVGILMQDGVQGGGGFDVFHNDADDAEAVFFHDDVLCLQGAFGREGGGRAEPFLQGRAERCFQQWRALSRQESGEKAPCAEEGGNFSWGKRSG